MKKLVVLLSLVVLVLAMAGCQTPVAEEPPATPTVEQADPAKDMPSVTPEEVVSLALGAMQKGELEEANSYFKYAKLITVHEGPFAEHQKLLLSKMEYTISDWGYSSADTAFVDVEITNFDFEHLFHNEFVDQYLVFAKDRSATAQNWRTTSSDLFAMFEKAFPIASKTQTAPVKVDLTLVDGVWKIHPSDELRAALAPGIDPFNSMYSAYSIDGMYNRLEAVLNPLDIVIFLDENDMNQDLSKVPFGFGDF